MSSSTRVALASTLAQVTWAEGLLHTMEEAITGATIRGTMPRGTMPRGMPRHGIHLRRLRHDTMDLRHRLRGTVVLHHHRLHGAGSSV